MEREGGKVSASADRAPAVFRPRRAGGVLDDRDTPGLAELAHRVKVGGHAAWSTRITARVRSVSTGSTVSGVRFSVSASTSAKTGRAPT